jgi:hypothetical protein
MELLDQLSLMNNTTETIVCPMPEPWDNLHKLICHTSYPEAFKGLEKAPAVRRSLAEGYKFEIPYPIMLAEWSARDKHKRERFLQHIKIAEKNNVLDDVKVFLFKLRKQEFHYESH